MFAILEIEHSGYCVWSYSTDPPVGFYKSYGKHDKERCHTLETIDYGNRWKVIPNPGSSYASQCPDTHTS